MNNFNINHFILDLIIKYNSNKADKDNDTTNSDKTYQCRTITVTS